MKQEEKLEEIRRLISNPVFADRESINDALKYAIGLAQTSSEGVSILTAVYVVTNTIAKELSTLEKYDKSDSAEALNVIDEALSLLAANPSDKRLGGLTTKLNKWIAKNEPRLGKLGG